LPSLLPLVFESIQPHRFIGCISVQYKRLVVGPRGMHIGPGYIHDIEDWPRLKNKKEVERLLGLINYQSAFIEEYTQMAPPRNPFQGPGYRLGKAEQLSNSNL
jgi:hypothetical protein